MSLQKLLEEAKLLRKTIGTKTKKIELISNDIDMLQQRKQVETASLDEAVKKLEEMKTIISNKINNEEWDDMGSSHPQDSPIKAAPNSWKLFFKK